jgi:polyferredoxin
MKTLRIPFLMVVFLYIVLFRKKFKNFCTMCPVGTSQDVLILLNKHTFKKYLKLEPTIKILLNISKYIVLLITLGVIFIMNNPRFMIPYHTFSLDGLFYESTYYIMKLIIVGLILIISIFMARPWCKICPFGTLLSLLDSTVGKLKNTLFVGKSKNKNTLE